MATNEYLQSIVAKAISDIEYLRKIDRTECNESLLGNATGDIIKFSAFISKVQNNFLWFHFPETFKLLHHYKIEIRIFAQYLPIHQKIKQDGIKNVSKKIEVFVDFLREYLQGKKKKEYRVLSYVLIHEEILWKLKEQNPSPTIHLPHAIAPPSLVIHINGRFVIRQFPELPEILIQNALADGPCVLSRKKINCVYFFNPASLNISIFTVSKEAALVLELIDKQRSLKRVEVLLKGRMSKSTLRDILVFLLENEIITINSSHANTTYR